MKLFMERFKKEKYFFIAYTLTSLSYSVTQYLLQYTFFGGNLQKFEENIVNNRVVCKIQLILLFILFILVVVKGGQIGQSKQFTNIKYVLICFLFNIVIVMIIHRILLMSIIENIYILFSLVPSFLISIFFGKQLSYKKE